MQILRIHESYEFNQAELNSMFVVKLNFPPSSKPFNLINIWNNDEYMLRLFGRFLNSIYGLDIAVLKQIVSFSTIQCLQNAELYFLDELSDDDLLFYLPSIKNHLLNTNQDALNEKAYPHAFIKRVKILYELKKEIFSFNEI